MFVTDITVENFENLNILNENQTLQEPQYTFLDLSAYLMVKNYYYNNEIKKDKHILFYIFNENLSFKLNIYVKSFI